jgi:peptidoglycan/xylan/chitin deacetylase (PgdA/CDA1 family)
MLLAYWVLHYSRVLQALDYLFFPSKGSLPLILNGHRILDDRDDTFLARIYLKTGSAIRDGELKRRITWLKKHFDILSLDSACKAFQEKPPRKRRIACLTFDDCYDDFRTVLMPIVEELNASATVFISTGMVNSRELSWFDEIYALAAAKYERGTEAARLKVRRAAAYVIQTTEMYISLRDTDRKGLLESTRKLCGEPVDYLPLYLSSSQIREIGRCRLMDIGSHTVNHSFLSELSDEALGAELELSKRELEQWSGRQVRHLSYPNDHWNQNVCDMAENAGYQAAFATGSGSFDSMYALPRVGLAGVPFYEFCCRTTVAYQSLRQCIRRRKRGESIKNRIWNHAVQ